MYLVIALNMCAAIYLCLSSGIYIYIVLRSLHSIPCFFLAKAIPIDGYEMGGDEMEEEPRVEPVTTDKNPPKTLEVDWC